MSVVVPLGRGIAITSMVDRGSSALWELVPKAGRTARNGKKVASNASVTLQDVAVDARAVFRSSQDEFAEPWTPDTIKQFLHSYQDRLTSAHNLHFTERLTEEAPRFRAGYLTVQSTTVLTPVTKNTLAVYPIHPVHLTAS
ncbi:MAG: hypothetical protein M1839_008310 [Geoglossum umbratile]|nr:MAG: hypothetical protein M1839_008310 [Geoglossum umbratile]